MSAQLPRPREVRLQLATVAGQHLLTRHDLALAHHWGQRQAQLA